MNPKLPASLIAANSAWISCAEETITSLKHRTAPSRNGTKHPRGMPPSAYRHRVGWREDVTTSFSQLTDVIPQTSHLDAWVVEKKAGTWRHRCGPDAPGPFSLRADTRWTLEERTTRPLTRPLWLALQDQAGRNPDGFSP